MICLENNVLKVCVEDKGAELSSLFHKKYNLEYIWDGDSKFWPRKAPLLFPIVGKLNDNTMVYNGQKYIIPQHGFVRDMLFEVAFLDNTSVTYVCRSTPETKKMFPFDWSLKSSYLIDESVLSISNQVTNESLHEDMYFSIGYHPAFRVPIEENRKFNDYFLFFNNDFSGIRWRISEGLIDDITEIAFTQNILFLNEFTFANDALVFKDLSSNQIQLKTRHAMHGLTLHFQNFPYLGIWSKPNASFVCIEPWHGIADNKSHNGDLTQKEGIIRLAPNSTFQCGYQIELF